MWFPFFSLFGNRPKLRSAPSVSSEERPCFCIHTSACFSFLPVVTVMRWGSAKFWSADKLFCTFMNARWKMWPKYHRESHLCLFKLCVSTSHWVASTTEVYCLSVLEVASQIKVLAGSVSSEGLKKNPFHSSPLASGGLLAVTGDPWLEDLCLHLHMTSFLCVCVCVCVCVSKLRHQSYWMGSPPHSGMTSF